MFGRAILLQVILFSAGGWVIGSMASASAESDSISSLVQSRQYLRLSDQIFETAALDRVYSARGYEPIWVSGGRLTDRGQALQNVLTHAERQGLYSGEYWTTVHENLLSGLNERNGVSLELALSNSLLRYARDLSIGRIDPVSVDEDIKFSRKSFDPAAVIEAINAPANGLLSALDALAPQHPLYVRLQKALVAVQQASKEGVWTTFGAPGTDLRPGSTHAVLSQVKLKLRVMGYNITEDGNVYTPELQQAILKFQEDTNVPKNAVLGGRAAIWTQLGMSSTQRIQQISLSLEKLRWLPRQLDSRHAFVNLAFQHLHLWEGGNLVMKMKTINGRPTRRTPSMRDQIPTVELNPDWTVPHSIATKDKLTAQQNDPDYLSRNNMRVYDSQSLQEVDPYSIDWMNLNPKEFYYTIKQMPGRGNALGTVRFDLTNPWAIYLHDTNERHLFNESNRALSSGCIRLEKPHEFALYLLQDQPEWSTLQSILQVIPKGMEAPKNPKLRVPVRRPLTVYTVYQTAQVDEGNTLRFAEDRYGQDARLASTLSSRKYKYEAKLPATKEGTLQVVGQAGPSQLFAKVVAIRCDRYRRGSCEEPVNFDLNVDQPLRAGSYILGFENSVNPGWVEIKAGQKVTINLAQVAVPQALQGETQVKIFRDLTSITEQNKIQWLAFYLGHQIFPLAEYDFGDLYLASANHRDVTSRLGADLCPRLGNYADATSEARELCQTFMYAQRKEQMSAFFEFQSDGTVLEQWISAPGDTFQVKLGRHLVSAPIRGTEFVAVFPGAYRALGTTQKNSVRFTTTGQISENY